MSNSFSRRGFLAGGLGIVAVVKSKGALEEIDANPGAYTNRGSVTAGRICGIISIVLNGAFVLIYGIAIAVGVLSELGNY